MPPKGQINEVAAAVNRNPQDQKNVHALCTLVKQGQVKGLCVLGLM